jgi:hypothetical protein
MLSVLSLLAFASPAARGALLGLAAAAKFAPAALLGLYAGHRDRGIKGTIACVVSFAAVVVTAIGLYLPSGGLAEFYNHTIGFQLTRSDVFSAWALHPSLDPLKLAVEIGAVLLAADRGVLPAPTVDGAGVRACRRDHDRLAAAGRALVLLLHRLVHAVRARRPARGGSTAMPRWPKSRG